MQLRKMWMSLAGLCWLAVVPAMANEANLTHEFVLDNGLHVIVREDHRSPALLVQVWYRVGAADEQTGKTGLAHLLEHMMFKGTEKVPEGEFSRLISRFGGNENAYTTSDRTVYYQQYGNADRLDLALELEADRMQNLRIDDDSFMREREVVMEERRLRTDDRPESVALERFEATAYTRSPYRNPIIGWMDDIRRLSVEDARDWYHRWYTPSNATLIITGDVDAAAVHERAKHWFGAIPASTLPYRVPFGELQMAGQKQVRLSYDTKVSTLYIGFVVPSLSSAADAQQVLALSMLTGVLDAGTSARLETHIVREQRLAAAIGSSYDEWARGDSLLTISVVPEEGVALADVQKAVLDEIEQLKKTPPTAAELQRVYAQILASKVFARDSLQGQAAELGVAELSGMGWRTIEHIADDLRAITPEQITAVAQRYLVSQNMTTLVLEPQENTDAK